MVVNFFSVLKELYVSLLQLAVIHSLRPCSFASPGSPSYAIFDLIICGILYLVFTKCLHILLYYISKKCPLLYSKLLIIQSVSILFSFSEQASYSSSSLSSLPPLEKSSLNSVIFSNSNVSFSTL